MQIPTSNTRRKSDPYQPQQSRTLDHLGNMQNRTFFPDYYPTDEKNKLGIDEFTLKQNF